MGIERVSRTTKLDPETDIWVEGFRLNVCPWLTRSAAINLILGIVRDVSAAKDLELTQDFWQQIYRKYRVPCVQEMQGMWGIPPCKAEAATEPRKKRSA